MLGGTTCLRFFVCYNSKMKVKGTEEFDKQYKRLNQKQKEAVDTIDGPVMVIAGPGTGKTTVLTLRVANILKRTDTPANGILAITYTDAGVKAIRAKLREIIGERAHEVNIHTFHSFAAAMIGEYPDHFIHLDGLTHLSDIEAESLIRKILIHPSFRDIRPIGKPDAYVSSIMRSIDDAKREALTADMVRNYAKKEIELTEKSEDAISTRGASKGTLKAEAKEYIEKCQRTFLFADVYEQYEKEKRKAGRMDFNDLIIELLAALRNDELFLRLIQERFMYLLVDEHQDTNDAQNFIIALIAEFFETPNIFIVGDEKQAIYRFQGASVENFLLLRKRWPAMKLISLDINYRSHQSLLDAGFSMIEKNYNGNEYEDLRVKLRSGGNIKSRPIDVVTGENSRAVDIYLVQELQTLMKKEPAASIAIITRRNRDLERVLRLLESNGVPVSSERSIDIFHHPIGVIFFDLLEFFSDPSKTDALAKTVASGLWGLSFEESVDVIRSLRSGKTEGLDKKLTALKTLQRKMSDDGAVGFIVDVAELSGFVSLVAKDPAYVYVWRGIFALAESIARESSVDDPVELIKKMLEYRASAESKTVKVSVGAPDLPLKAMTAHGSKGLEFDYVFMPFATEDAWVGRSRGSSFVLPKKRADDHDVRDLRRLFYVAITRARKHSVILAALEESDGKILTPVRFLEEIEAKEVNSILLPRANLELPKSDALKNVSKNRDGYSSKITALAKQVLTDTGLSVTALNHFIECPNKFLYESILKLPQAPVASAEKGTAMHEAISKIWKDKDRSAENAKKIIDDSIKEFFSESFLPTNEKEAVKKELFEDAPLVAAALEQHFSSKGQVFTERFVKTTFECSYGGKTVIIPIHGRLDAIVLDDSGVSVFDYKTKQAMSSAEIKGETKNSNGGYFRQLVFYNLLLANDPSFKMKRITEAFVFVSPDKKGRCPIIIMSVLPKDINNLKSQIKSVVESVWSGDISSRTCSDPECEFCAFRAVLNN